MKYTGIAGIVTRDVGGNIIKEQEVLRIDSDNIDVIIASIEMAATVYGFADEDEADDIWDEEEDNENEDEGHDEPWDNFEFGITMND